MLFRSLERGTFELPADPKDGLSMTVRWDELVMILEGVRLSRVAGGESLQRWEEYFPKAHLYGVDKRRKTNGSIGGLRKIGIGS